MMDQVSVATLVDLNTLPSAKEAFATLSQLDQSAYQKLRPLFSSMPLLHLLSEIVSLAGATGGHASRQAILDMGKLAIAKHPYTRDLFVQLAGLVAGSSSGQLEDLLLRTPALDARMMMQMLDLLAELYGLAGEYQWGLACYDIAARIAQYFGLELNAAVVMHQKGYFLAECGLFEEAERSLQAAAGAFAPRWPELVRRTNLFRVTVYCHRLRFTNDLTLPADLAQFLQHEPAAEQKVLLTYARNALDQDHLEEASLLCTKARALHPPQEPFLSELLLLESRIARRRGQFEEADLLLQQVATVEACADAGRNSDTGDQELHWERFYLARDLDRLERASALLSQLQETKQTAHLIYQQALVAFKARDFARAEQLFQQCLEGSGDNNGRANCYGMLGAIRIEQGRYDEAYRLIYRAIALYFKLNHRLDHAIALSNLSVIEREEGRQMLEKDIPGRIIPAFARSEQLLQAAQKIAEDLGADSVLLDIQLHRARLAGYQGNVDRALQHFTRALTHIELTYLSLTERELVLSYIRQYEPVYAEALFCAMSGRRFKAAFLFNERGKARRFLRDVAERIQIESDAPTNPLLQEEQALFAAIEPLRSRLKQGRPLTGDERQRLWQQEQRLQELWRQFQETATPEELAFHVRQPLKPAVLRHIVFGTPLRRETSELQEDIAGQDSDDVPKIFLSFENEAGVIPCPVCFVLNVIGSSFCSVCEQFLPKSASVNLMPDLDDPQEANRTYAEFLYNEAIHTLHEGKVEEADALLARAMSSAQHPDYAFFYGLTRLLLRDPITALASFDTIQKLQYARRYPFWPLPVSSTDFQRNLLLLRQDQTRYEEVAGNLLRCYREYAEQRAKMTKNGGEDA